MSGSGQSTWAESASGATESKGCVRDLVQTLWRPSVGSLVYMLAYRETEILRLNPDSL